MQHRDSSFLGDMLLGLILIFPIVFSPASQILGSDQVDVWNHVWGSWWWGHSFANGTLPWHTTLLQYPEGGTLWFIDPILALVGVLFGWISPVFSYNLTLWFYAAFASFGIRRFALSLGSTPTASWVASVTFTLSGWMLSEISNGITEAVNIGPAALALAWTEEACKEEIHPWRKWILAGVGVGLSTLASPYLGLGVGMAIAIRSLSKIHYAWLGGLVSILVASPILWAFRAQLHAADAIIKRPDGMNQTLALHNAVDPRTFIAPFGFQSVDLSSEGFVHTMYLGWIALFFASKAIKTHKAWVFSGLCCAVFALGPYLYWGDGWFLLNESRLRLPWFALQSIASGLAVTHPLRLAIPCLAIVAGLASVGANTPYWIDRMKWLCIAIAIDGLLISGAPFPIPKADASIPAIYDIVKTDTRNNGILDLPTDAFATMKTSKYLYWQTAHHKGIPYAPDARASTSSLLNNPAFRRLAALCHRRKDEHQRLGLHNRSPGSSHPQTLSHLGYGWIVLHQEIDPTVYQQLLEVLQADLGAGMTIDNATVWRLND